MSFKLQPRNSVQGFLRRCPFNKLGTVSFNGNSSIKVPCDWEFLQSQVAEMACWWATTLRWSKNPKPKTQTLVAVMGEERAIPTNKETYNPSYYSISVPPQNRSHAYAFVLECGTNIQHGHASCKPRQRSLLLRLLE